MEIREIYNREFGLVTPTYAVVGDWLVIGGNPQAVQGFVLRHAGRTGEVEPRRRDRRPAAQMPADAVGHPVLPAGVDGRRICAAIAPLVLGQIGMFSERNSPEFNPTDIGLIPNAHELSSHLFPNLTYTRDDGKTVRIDVHESFSLPLEFIGLEPFLFAALTGLR